VRTILRTILAFALLFGSGAADWAPVLAQAGVLNHESCCCGTPASSEDSCPCPKPEGNRSPSTALCALRTVAVASLTVRRTQGQRRTEPRPEPATRARALDVRAFAGFAVAARGRDPDLGRHLARLSTFRI
jgi:hypothetical protein